MSFIGSFWRVWTFSIVSVKCFIGLAFHSVSPNLEWSLNAFFSFSYHVERMYSLRHKFSNPIFPFLFKALICNQPNTHPISLEWPWIFSNYNRKIENRFILEEGYKNLDGRCFSKVIPTTIKWNKAKQIWIWSNKILLNCMSFNMSLSQLYLQTTYPVGPYVICLIPSKLMTDRLLNCWRCIGHSNLTFN